MHVVERFKMIDGGNTLQVLVTVDDPGAFNHALVGDPDLAARQRSAD